MWEQNVIDVHTDWYMLSFAYKWLDGSKIYTHALPDYPSTYKRDKQDDSALTKELWRVFDAADVLIAHNGDRFDIRKANARFIVHGLQPPRPYRTVDTLKLARKHKFDSNKLDDLGRYLGVGRKIANTGKKLWLGCMDGDDKSWRTMRRYNANDVALLERVYLRLRGWATTHPDLSIYTRSQSCPTCQGVRVTQQGVKLTKTGHRQQYKCLDCGSWHSGAKHIREIV